MSEQIIRVNQSFFSCCDGIEKELSDLTRTINSLQDDELNKHHYLRINQWMDHIQGLFDKASVVMKELTLDQSNPDLYTVLQRKSSLNELYGFLHKTRSNLKTRYERLHNIDSEREDQLSREFRNNNQAEQEDNVPAEEVPEEPEEEYDFDAEMAAIQAEIEAEEKEKKQKEKRNKQKRQDQLRQEDARREEERRLETGRRLESDRRREAEQRYRQEQAAQLGMATAPGKDYSEAEIRNERLRQEDAQREAQRAAEERRAREDQMLADHQRRMEESAGFDGLNKSHNDFSQVNRTEDTYTPAGPAPTYDDSFGYQSSTTGQANVSSSSYTTSNDDSRSHTFEQNHERFVHVNSEQATSPNPDPIAFSYTPTGTAPTYTDFNDRKSDNFGQINVPSPNYTNKEIYTWLNSYKQNHEQSGTAEAISVSVAFAEQMRYNVETARMEYHAARGTQDEQAAAHRYLQERSAYEELQHAIKENRFVLEEPVVPSPTDQQSSSYRPSPGYSAQSAFAAFTPDGVEGFGVEGGRPNTNSYVFNNPGILVNVSYDASSPMRVTPAYETELYNRMKEATGLLNNIVSSGPSAENMKVPVALASEIRLATQAYLGFQSAKEAGSVVVSDDADVKSPDFRMWQQQYRSKSSTINISEPQGSTAHFRNVKNKATKESTAEVSASLLKNHSELKRQTIASRYFSIVESRFENYSSIASARLGRRVYQLLQSGEENALRTMENTRYYISTGVGIVSAVYNAHPVMSSAAAAAKLARWEFNRFGDLTALDNATLTRQIHDHKKAATALKNEIKELFSKGKNLTKDERLQLLNKLNAHRKMSGELNKEISYSKYRQRNALSVKAAQDLKAKHKGFVTIRNVDDEFARVQTEGRKAIDKKFGKLKGFGKLNDVTDRSLRRRIAELEKKGPQLKAQIKLLQAKGNALTAAERVQLKKLIDTHKENSQLLRKLIGLKDARGKLNDQLDALRLLRKRMVDNSNAWTNGFYLAQNFLLKPILNGSEIGAMGLANGVRIATNRHVRKFVKKGLKLSVNAARAGIELVAPGTNMAVQTSVGFAKQVVKANVLVAKQTIKTAVKKTVVKYTPPSIKTAVQSGTAALQRMSTGVRGAIASAKQWFSGTKLGRGISAVKRFTSNTAKALRVALNFVKSIALKALAIFVVIFLLVGVFSVIMTSVVGSTGSSVIMSPYVASDGRISLEPYVDILEAKEKAWKDEIEALETKGDYDNVIIKYGTSMMYNYKEILCMMAVKMDQDLDLQQNSDIGPYLERLFDVSHSYSVTESFWTCSPGCDTKLESYTRYCDTEDGTCLEVEPPEPEEGEESVPVKCEGHLDYKEVPVCYGHIDLYVTKYVTGFDELFTADELGLSAVGSAGIGTFDSTLGGVSAKYEAGGINPGMISSGHGDYGGKSYGTWQLASNVGSLENFVNWLKTGVIATPNSGKIAEALSAHSIASSGFDTAWKEMANQYHDEFQELQAQYIYRMYCAPFIQKAYSTYGVDLSRSKALTELAFSTSVQFGPNNVKVLGSINESMSDEEIIKTCYAYKRDNVDTLFRSSSSAIRNSLKNNRFVTEEKDLLSLIDKTTPPVEDDNKEEEKEDDGRYWNEERIDQAKLFYNQDWAALYDVYFANGTGNLTTPLTEQDIEEIIEACKAEYPELSEDREKAIRTALSLVGEVVYYWGGGHESSLKPGWNDKWGTLAPPSDSGTKVYTVWGLDCSGFMRWTFYTAFDIDMYPYVVPDIRYACTAIRAADALPGDMASTEGDTHIGMYLYTREDGQKVFVHCGGSGVSLTTEYAQNFTQYFRSKMFERE